MVNVVFLFRKYKFRSRNYVLGIGIARNTVYLNHVNLRKNIQINLLEFGTIKNTSRMNKAMQLKKKQFISVVKDAEFDL